MDPGKCVAKGAIILAAAPEELRPVLNAVKMGATIEENKKSLASNKINTEMLGQTLAFLLDTQVNDERIAGLLKEGRKDLIIRELINLMPLACVTCNRDTEYQVGDKPAVRCRRCSRGACRECFPLPQNGWVYLCCNCDRDVLKQCAMPEAFSKKKKKVGNPSTQGVATQNLFITLGEGIEEEEDDDEENEEEEEEEEEWQIAARRREEKKRNEEGGKKEVAISKEKEICKPFKFGGKCPHRMGGMKKHKQWDKCNKSHPKVCNKLLTHGPKGSKGCNGNDCDKYHPKMCYSSLNTKVCSKEKCTYWHCKGTSFAPDSRARYEPPSRYSLSQYPVLPERRGRSPVRREQEPRHRTREEPVRGAREERREGGERREDVDQERRRREERCREESRRRDERSREEGRKSQSDFLDLAQLIRQEVQRAFLSLLPQPGASGSAAGPLRTPAVTTTPNWAELLGRVNIN